MKKTSVFVTFAAALALTPSLFAVSGKTMFHYIAYEAAFWNKNIPVKADQYSRNYLDGLEKLPFDTLVFAPWLGFGAVAGILQSASYPTYQGSAESVWLRSYRNAMPELVKLGADPIAETVKWCRRNKREAVVALPVNNQNTHTRKPDAKYPNNSWQCFLFSKFLSQNPDCLMNPDGKTSCPYGDSTSADYTNAKVRDKFVAIATEIAGKYDIDGIMVDFTMVPTLFRSVVAGGTAAPKELALVTEMMTKIKAACKAASGRLGHPVALSARVPDSVGYCKDIGIDLQGWFDSKLLDYVVLGGYFQLNHWGVTGSLAAKAGLPWYVSFTQSGITVFNDSGYSGDDERMPRNSAAVCRARIAEALLQHATGCMFTMGQHFEVQMSRNVCVPYDAKANRTGDKRYFVTYTNDRSAGRYLKDGDKYRTYPSLISNHPVDLGKGSQKFAIDVWEDFDSLKRDGIEYKTVLITEIEFPSGVDATVTFNGKELKCYKKRAGTQMYELPPGSIKKGANEVLLKSKGKSKRGGTPKLGNICIEVKFPKK